MKNVIVMAYNVHLLRCLRPGGLKMRYISYKTIDGNTKNINVNNLTEDQIINELVRLQCIGESGNEPPLQNITLVRDGNDYIG